MCLDQSGPKTCNIGESLPTKARGKYWSNVLDYWQIKNG